jgi:hypothetical protein
MFKPTYLYIKTHNKTGLKYFGKTTKNNPYKYTGSGFKWINHLKKHGNDVTTEIVGYYTNQHDCVNAAIEFSKNENIVNSDKWANLIVETGIDESLKHLSPKSIKQRTATVVNKYGDNYFAKIAAGSKSAETKKKISESLIKTQQEGNAGKKNKGKIRIKIQCPHCHKEGSNNTMLRWHFNNCKSMK